MRVKPVVQFMTDLALEARANALLARYEESKGALTAPPVDVDYISEFTLDLSFDYETFDDFNTLAYVSAADKQIVINELRMPYFEEHPGTYEFTVAHEVGHYDMHFEDISQQQALGIDAEGKFFICREKVSKSDQYYHHERQADKFAACLLMPRKLLLPLTYERDLTWWPMIYDLARLFKVSPTALLTRLEQLKLVYCRNQKLYYSLDQITGRAK